MAIIFFTMLTLFLYYDNIYAKQMEDLKALSEEKSNRQALLNEYLSKGYGNAEKLKEEKAQLQANVQELYTKVPGYVGEPEILVGLNHLIEKHYLYAEKISFKEYQDVKGYGRLPVSLNVEGDQANIYRLLNDLENYSRPVRISSVEFSPADSFWMSCSISADFYVLGTPLSDPDNYDFLKTTYGVLPAYDMIRPIIESDFSLGADIGSDSELNTGSPEFSYEQDESGKESGDRISYEFGNEYIDEYNDEYNSEINFNDLK